jgi:hypothetical protein
VKGFRFVMILVALFSLMLLGSAYSAPLSLTIGTDKQVYNVGDRVTFTGSVNNGSAVPDALVLFEVDTPEGKPWIIRTFTTGQTPAGPFGVQLLNVTPTDTLGNPDYTFSPNTLAGFMVFMQNKYGSSYPVLVAINVFFSNGLPFAEQIVFNQTLQAGEIASTLATVIIPGNAVLGQAIVCASIFNAYPKNNGFAYSPEQSATFNITSGIPKQATYSRPPLGNFNSSVPLTSTVSLPIWLGNYTVFATTRYGIYSDSAQTNFTARLAGDLTGPKGVPDGKVDIRDVNLVAKAYGSSKGPPASSNWNPICDLTGPNGVPDGKVDIRDVNFVAREYGIVAVPAP